MLLKSAIEEVSGLRYLFEQLELSSGLGRRMLLNAEFLTSKTAIQTELSKVDALYKLLANKEFKATAESLCTLLSQVRDINGTIKNMERGHTLDDVELFEVKHFAMLSAGLRTVAADDGRIPLSIEDLSDIINLLDPEGFRVPSFYIYDTYDGRLCDIRKMIKQTSDERKLAELYDTASAIEDEVRTRLSEEIQKSVNSLSKALEQAGALDILIAKAKMAIKKGFFCPTLSADKTEYVGLFNPQVKDILAANKKQFQPVDVALTNGITMINGANMAGKTLLLKTLSISQHLCQFGFFVPAKSATISPVAKVLTCIGDDQSEEKGLSAYAAEMLKVNRMITDAKSGEKLLILIDELARTTNPTEGKAIVAAAANLLNELGVKGIITTHYSGINSSCRKLRVKGFSKNIDGEVKMDNITDFIDYSLEDDDTGNAPQEAIRIAGLLGVDTELLERAKKEVAAAAKPECSQKQS